MFGVDLAADKHNHVTHDYLTKEEDALALSWASNYTRPGFCNPPYSDIDPWLEKAVREARKGFTSVFLVPAPNGEDRYGAYVFGVATEIIHITGRIAFIDPSGKPVGGNTRGSCVVVYERYSLGHTRHSHVWRDAVMKEFGE